MTTFRSIFSGVFFVVAAQLGVAQTPPSTQFNIVPSRIVGQPTLQQQGVLTMAAPNLVEGREFSNPQAIAIDTSASPPILYVADTGNNRVLAWKNAFGFTKGDFADKVIGQRDLFSTTAQGPGRDLSTGLNQPVALAVDKKGNLYVADAGNNRILRYPSPLAQTGDLLPVDLIIGQKDLGGRNPNEGLNAPTEKTLAFANNSGAFNAGLTFDAQGNLWVSDPINNRVLRYPVSALGSSASNEPAADLVLGESDFVTGTPQNTSTLVKCGSSTISSSACAKNFIIAPTGLAFDPKGRLFVPDTFNRVLVFTPPLQTGQIASRIMGIDTSTPPPPVSASTLGINGAPPSAVFFVGNNPYVADAGNARVLGYDPFDQWADENTAFSPPAKVVIGQPSLQGFQSNRSFAQPSNQTLAGPQSTLGVGASGPAAGVFAGTDLFVVDAGNSRVIVFPQSGSTFGPATRLLGQFDFQYNSRNLIEGREFGFLGNLGSCSFNGVIQFATGGGVALDNNSNPPHLYVADPTNNRVLGYLDARKVNAGSIADIVIGQPDLKTAEINYPTNNITQGNDSGLWSPENVAVDSNGDLFVADTCNARVLRFASPFTQQVQNLQRANLVLGQTSFFGQPIRDLSRQTMRSSYGLAFTASRGLVVSDPIANRVLYFKRPAGGDFKSGDPAVNVFGQKDFTSTTTTVFSSPRGIAVDPDDQLYVADFLNGRMAILPNIPTAGDNPPVLLSVPGFTNPFSVAVNQITDEVWVTNSAGSGQTLRFPHYQALLSNPTPNVVLNNSFGPVSVALDPFGNPVIAEAITNRVTFFYPAIDFTSSAGGVAQRESGNGANFLGRFAPGMIASIFPFANARFGDQTASYSNTPPYTLGDVQVFVGGLPAPLFYVSPSQINFQVPSATPTGGLQEIQVVRASVGQVLASWLFRIDEVSPGLFTANSTGNGQISAINADDNTINGPSNPCKAGSYISLYGTGTGILSNQPPDGQPAQGPINTIIRPKVFINADFVPDSDIQYSGAAPGYVGLWQINVKVPANVPSGDVQVFVQYISVSIQGPSGLTRKTTIRTKP
ncbi:MAG TPA: hypothetical protein VEU96_29250 [Bryobacteraceae bacterium]|nr:hypothetical protein [Bryobacteraceae bacterium]